MHESPAGCWRLGNFEELLIKCFWRSCKNPQHESIDYFENRSVSLLTGPYKEIQLKKIVNRQKWPKSGFLSASLRTSEQIYWNTWIWKNLLQLNHEKRFRQDMLNTCEDILKKSQVLTIYYKSPHERKSFDISYQYNHVISCPIR